MNTWLPLILLNLKSLPQRWGGALVIVVGISGVVAVLVALLAMSEGFRKTLSSTGDASRAIVLREGASAELSSTLARDALPNLAELVGVRRNGEGAALLSGEASVILNVMKRGTRSNVALRGVGPLGFALRPECRVLQGRLFRPGLRELMVGAQAAKEFDGLAIGQTLRFREADWRITGHFGCEGNVHESELWADADTVLAAYRRNLLQSALVQLETPEAFGAFAAAAAADKRLQVSVLREPDYYAEQSKALATLIRIMGQTVAAIMAVGATCGALNAMQAAVAARTREIATLRALGFGPAGVVLAVMLESALLAALGGALGAGLSWLAFNGMQVSTLNFASFSQVAFPLTVTPGLVLQGLCWALAMGLVGALLPALRAARLPVVDALRTL